MGRDDYLFFQADSSGVQEHQRKEMEAGIAGMDGNRLLNTNVDDLISYFAEKHSVDVPFLDEANMSVDQREARRDVSGDPSRMAYFTGQRPVHVTGTEVIVEVPFSGDPEKFKVRPSTYDSGPPRGEVRGNTILFRFWSDNPQPEKLRSELDRWLADVKRYLQWQRESFKGFNDSLVGSARTAITRRREKLSPTKTSCPVWGSHSSSAPKQRPPIRRPRSNGRSRPRCRRRPPDRSNPSRFWRKPNTSTFSM